jgi:hypothetical protein
MEEGEDVMGWREGGGDGKEEYKAAAKDVTLLVAFGHSQEDSVKVRVKRVPHDLFDVYPHHALQRGQRMISTPHWNCLCSNLQVKSKHSIVSCVGFLSVLQYACRNELSSSPV